MNMMHQETGDHIESSHGNLDYGNPTDDEEVTIPPHDIIKFLTFRILISVISKLCQIHNEKTGCYQRSPCMGLAHDRPVGSALR